MQNNVNFDENTFCNNSCSEKYFLDWQWIIIIIIDIMIIFINSIVDHFLLMEILSQSSWEKLPISFYFI